MSDLRESFPLLSALDISSHLASRRLLAADNPPPAPKPQLPAPNPGMGGGRPPNTGKPQTPRFGGSHAQ